MYHIGEGGTNLKKMDKHVRRKQGNIKNLFSSTVINDKTLKKMQKSKVRIMSKSKSIFSDKNEFVSKKPSDMARSHSTADSARMRFKTATMTDSQIQRASGPFSLHQRDGSDAGVFDLSTRSGDFKLMKREFSETQQKIRRGHQVSTIEMAQF